MIRLTEFNNSKTIGKPRASGDDPFEKYFPRLPLE